MLQDYVQALTRAILGSQEYHEAFRPMSQRSPRWRWRFWGRCGIALIAVVFFLYQQLGSDVHLFFLSSEFVAGAVLVIGLLQAAAPLGYLIMRFFFLFFVTERYKRDLSSNKWPDLWRSLLVLISEAVLIVLAASGFLPHRWYLVLLVFFWSFPVALFYLILPAFVLWGFGHRMFLTLAHFDDRLERPGEPPRNYRGS